MIDTDYRLRAVPAGLRSELQEAASNHGYRRETGEADGWLYFASDINVPGEIGLAVAADGVCWFLAVEHPGVAAELDAPAAAPVPQGKRAAFGFVHQSAMRGALHRAYVLATTLPTLPLLEFEAAVAGLGDTEAERLLRVRIGQDHFRGALMGYWNGRCPLTGIEEPALLRASHIVPWAQCASDEERLNVHNGLLLAAHWDAAFDAGLVSFEDDGSALFSPHLGAAARQSLGRPSSLAITDEHRTRLAWHRSCFGFDSTRNT
ncbi:HNH endonuclease [Sphingomonas sp. DG1-23]|uniref:HNH endonuclease n=1 Tax=Sphingomonas sp. DG1-23 TaxID=3068316 RepID=UPI00273DA4DC|nr:HNH endonuclease [Sphingomonas sp. DG1-23]MDP5281416.1 HNH endonuclease [Sphingomonas sp. DG1-23]